MNKRVCLTTVIILLFAVNLFAADGDLLIEGKVGIGTTSPQAKLNLEGTDYGTTIRIGNSNTVGWSEIDFINSPGGGSGRIGRTVVNGSNYVYDHRTFVEDWGNGLSFIVRNGETGDIRFYLGPEDEAGNVYEKVRFATSGNVGIGVTNPNYQLQLSMNSAAKPGSSTWTIASDARLKTNIQPYTKGLAEILQINPMSYQYNGKGSIGHRKICTNDLKVNTCLVNKDGTDCTVDLMSTKCDEKDVVDTDLLSKTYVGIIAQDIQTVLPETVTSHRDKLNAYDSVDTDILDFDAHSLTFILINAVKELNAKIDSLNRHIASLEQSSSMLCQRDEEEKGTRSESRTDQEKGLFDAKNGSVGDVAALLKSAKR